MATFPPQGVTERFLQQSEAWLREQGLEEVLGRALDETKRGKVYAIWRSASSLITPQTEQAGFFDPLTRRIFTRALDPATFFHELAHGQYLLNGLASEQNPERHKEEKNIDEGLAFTLEVALFGCEKVARSYLANEAYTTKQAQYAHMMMENYMLGGNFAFERILSLASDLKERVKESPKNHGWAESYLSELFNLDKTVDLVKQKISVPGKVFGTNEEQIVKYFTEAFKVPQSVAEYIFKKCEYQSLDEAIRDLSPIKTGTINAYKRIKSGLFFFAGEDLETAEREAVQLIRSDLHLAVVKDLGEFEKAVSLAYQVGGTELSKFITRKAFSDPVCERYLSENLPGVLQALEDITPSVKSNFVRRMVSEDAFKRFLEIGGYSVINSFAKDTDPLRTTRYLTALSGFKFPEVVREGSEMSWGSCFSGHIKEINDYLRLSDLTSAERLTISEFIPELAALATVLITVPLVDYQELVKHSDLKRKFKPFQESSGIAWSDQNHGHGNIGWLLSNNDLNKNNPNFIDAVLIKANEAGGDLREGIQTEISRLTALTNGYMGTIKSRHENLEVAGEYYQTAMGAFDQARKERDDIKKIGLIEEARRNLSQALTLNPYNKCLEAARKAGLHQYGVGIGEIILTEVAKVNPADLKVWEILAYCVRENSPKDPERQKWAEYCSYKAKGGE